MTKPIIVVKALLLFIKKDEPYFLELIRSQKKVVAPGLGDLPGGKVDDGEPLLDALKREIFEEAGMAVNSLHKVISYDWIHESAQRYEEHLYCAKVDTQDVGALATDEHDSYQWRPLSQIQKSTMHPNLKKQVIDSIPIINAFIHSIHKK